jgi:exosome complex component RRP4
MRNEINEAHESAEQSSDTPDFDVKRRVVIPGEIIVSSEDALPGDGARREGENIVANRFGLAEEAGRLIKVIPISGAFVPRRGNVVIGLVTDITYAGWLVDIDSAGSAFLPIDESPRFINRNELDQFLKIGDVVAAKIWSVKSSKSIDLTLKARGLGKLEDGFTFKIIPARVPRVIGREGSMINLIKDKTGCNITVGQNGWVWIKGTSTDSEIKARKAIEFIANNVHLIGLTEKVEAWFAEQ